MRGPLTAYRHGRDRRPHARNPVDIAADACERATHLDLLVHQLGEASVEPAERERLAAALAEVEAAIANVAASVGLPPRRP
ncbi:hypothetical protein ACTWPT_37400 [Nonomuraea sp. 3N208]|uniref:hypothetical protein n=1 Tax=Nonomuraea sp. 3N208 TaxID=3457421 RepID=UPI003FD46DE8